MTESHADPPRGYTDDVEVFIKIGNSFKVLMELDPKALTAFTMAVQRVVAEYAGAITIPPTSLPSIPARPRATRVRSRPKGEHAVMRQQLREQVDARVLAPHVEEMLSKRGEQSGEIQGLYWALVDSSIIEPKIARPAEFPVINQETAERKIRSYANLAYVD